MVVGKGDSIGQLYILLAADTKGLDKADQKVKQFTEKTEKRYSALTRATAVLATATASLYASYRVLRVADEYSILQQRIKTATKATGDYASVSQQLYDISVRTGSELSANVGLFQSLARVSGNLAATNTEMLKLTQVVNQLGVIGGATTGDMKFGLIQFTQAMGEGIFRAQEFNSILENMPEVANRIAKGMNMTTSELRKAVIEGRLLSTDVFEALLKQSEEINEEFQDLDKSIGRSLSSLFTTLTRISGEWFKQQGIIDSIAGGIDTLTNKLNKMGGSGFFKKFGKGFAMAMGGATQEQIDVEIKQMEESNRKKEELRQQDINNQAAKEQKMKEIMVAANDERERLLTLNALFETDIFKKTGQDTLQTQATNFRKGIGMAAQHSKEFFAIQKAFLLATAIMETPSAIMSAFNFGNKLGGPPVGLAMAGIASAFSGVQIGAIAGASYSGGRQTGGSVNPNRMYRVNENGPEMLTMGNQEFLLTGSRGGNITARNNMSNGSPTVVNVSIINTGEPMQVKAEKTDTAEGFNLELLLDRADQRVAAGIRNGDGATNQAISSVFNLNRTAGAIN